MLGLSILVSGSGLSIGAAQEPADPVMPVVQATVAAEEAIQNNEPQLAESRYRTALLEGWLLLAALAVADNDWDAAKAAYEAAMSSAVETHRARLSLAALHIRTGAPAEAIGLLRMIIAKDLRDSQARRLLAQALAADDQLGESALELESLRVLYPDDLESLYLLAAVHLKQEQLEAAEPLFAKLAALRPIPQTFVLIGRTYRDFFHYHQARDVLERALELEPEIQRAHYYLGTIDFLDRGLSGLPDAIDHFEAELRVSPGDPSTNLYLGMALVEQRREEEAIAPLEAASRYPPAERDSLHFLSRAYLRVGREADAVVTLRRALEIAEAEYVRDPDGFGESRDEKRISQLHYQLGLALRRTGEEKAAQVHFQAAEDSFAREVENSRDRMRRFLQDEVGDQKLELFGSPLDSSPVVVLTNPERANLAAGLTHRLAQAYLNLGILQAQRKRIPRAADLFQQAADLEPDFPRVQYSLGVARFNSGQYQQATEPLSRALESEPSSAELRRMLALAWLNSEHYEQAAELLAQDEGRKADRSLQYAYGVALVRSGRATEAEHVFAELLARTEDWPEIHVVLGQAFAQQDDFARAIESLQTAIELKPDVPEAHSTLGDIHMRHGRLEEAEQEVRTELRYRPEDLRAQYLLATVLELAGKSADALQILDLLLDTSPRSANARYLKGKILLAQGLAEEAQIQLETAARLDPADPETHYQLGLALQRQGLAEEARREFETYQSLKRNEGSGESP